MRSSAKVALAGGVLVLAAAAAYRTSFSVPFLLDDPYVIAENASVHHVWPPWDALSPPAGGFTVSGRPVLNLSFAINYAISGTGVWSYHLLNLAIHILAGLALFGIARRTIARVSTGGGGRAMPATAAAFFIALLWMLHPLQTASVTYISQRAESLMGMFYLLTLYCFIRGAEFGPVREVAGSELRKARSGRQDRSSSGSLPKAANELRYSPATSRTGPNSSRVQRVWFGLSWVACLLGMGTKEVMVSAPLIVLLYDRTFVEGTFRAAWKARRTFHSALAGTWIALGALVARSGNRGGTAGFGNGASSWKYALTQAAAITHYLHLAIWPHPLVFDYGKALANELQEVWPQAVVVTALLAGTIFCLVRARRFPGPALRSLGNAGGFCGAWFFAILAPSSSFIPISTETMAEHRMYLPLAAVIAAGVLALGAGLRGGFLRRSSVVLAVLAAGLGWMTAERNEVYRDPKMLWGGTVAEHPENARAHSNLGNALASEGRTADAIDQYREALRLDPGSADAHNNLGVAQESEVRLAEAAVQYREAIRLNPDFADALGNLGNASLKAGRPAEAIDLYSRALRLRPDFPEAHYNLGSALFSAGRPAEAGVEFEEALRLRPDFPEAARALAIVRRAQAGHS